MKELAARRRGETAPWNIPAQAAPSNVPRDTLRASSLRMPASGIRHGRCQVSEKHCGFVINGGNATASGCHGPVRTYQKDSWNNLGVELEMEVKRQNLNFEC